MYLLPMSSNDNTLQNCSTISQGRADMDTVKAWIISTTVKIFLSAFHSLVTSLPFLLLKGKHSSVLYFYHFVT